jgi:hypothetical protein
MTGRRRKARLVLAGLGAFLVLVVGAGALMRAGRPGRTDPPAQQAASATTAPSDGQRATDRPGSENAAEQSEDGAVSAALAYVVAPQAWLYMTDDEIRSAVAGVAVAEVVDRLGTEVVGEVSAARIELANSAGPVWWIVHPLAWRVDSYDHTQATVSVWGFSLLSAADVAIPQTEWATTTLELRWTQDTWRVASVTDTVGPTPAVGPKDQPWEPEPLDDALQGFTRLSWEDRR